MPALQFSHASDLAVPAERMLATLTMDGVNAELGPWLRMTAPAGWAEKPIGEWPTAQPLFASWILLLGVVPVDRHFFQLRSVQPGSGFVEESSSLVNRSWVHQRSVTQVQGGCRMVDSVHYRSRLPLLGHLLKPVYRLVFWWRHRRLRSRFGMRES